MEYFENSFRKLPPVIRSNTSIPTKYPEIYSTSLCLLDVFKTIKYGWPEKGMKSWKDDLSPVQVSQVTSFIKSLHGSNPPNAKEKQGELFQEANATPETNKVDSTEKKVAGITHS